MGLGGGGRHRGCQRRGPQGGLKATEDVTEGCRKVTGDETAAALTLLVALKPERPLIGIEQVLPIAEKGGERREVEGGKRMNEPDPPVAASASEYISGSSSVDAASIGESSSLCCY